MKPAIIAVGYNRPKALKRLLTSVGKAKYDDINITLVISLDKASNENEVVQVAQSFNWNHGEKIIRTFPERQGLRKHIIQCGDLSEKYDAVIILEDDLIVSPNFYRYVQKALDFYCDEPKATGIALYSHEWNGYANRNYSPIADGFDTYFGQYSITWGQCWTYSWWTSFKKWYLDHENKLGENAAIPSGVNRWSAQSWGKYFVNYIVEKDLYYIIPRISLSTNCSDVGQHNQASDNSHQVRLLYDDIKEYVFASYDRAQKYDIFFENKRLADYLSQVNENKKVCINLSGISRSLDTFDYVLTTATLPFKIVREWGLMLRPIDMNIVMDMPGKEIKLYDLHSPEKCAKDASYEVMKYECKGFIYKDIGKYASQLYIRAIKRKIMVIASKIQRIWKNKK